MAETKKYIAEFEINADGAIVGIKKIRETTDDATGSVNSLKKELRLLNAELAATDPQSEKYTELAKKAGELKDQINDASEAVRANAGSAFEQASGNASLLTQRLGNLDFEGAAQSAKALGAQMKTLKFGDLVKGVKDFAMGLKSLATAMLGNPVFLALTALVLAITAIGLAWKKSEQDAENATLGMVKAAERAAQARALQDREEIARAQGAADKIYAIRISSLTETIKEQKKLTDEANAYFLRGEEGTQEQIKAWNAAKQKLDEASTAKRELYYARKQQLDTESFNLERKYRQIGMSESERAYDDLDNMFEDQIKKLRELGASADDIAKTKEIWKSEEQKLDDKFAKEAADKNKAATDKRREEIKALNTELIAAANARRLALMDNEDKELAQAEITYNEQLKKAGKNAKLIAQVQANYDAEKIAITNRYNLERQKAIDANHKAVEAAEREHQQELEDIQEAARRGGMTERQRAEEDARTEYFNKRTQLEFDNTEASKLAILQLDEAYRQEQLRIQQEYDTKDQEAADEADKITLENKKAALQKQLDTTQQYLSYATAILDTANELQQMKMQKNADAISKLDQQIADAKTADEKKRLIAQRRTLEQEGKRAFEKNKKLQIALAIANTAQAIVAAVGSQLVPGDPSSVARAIAAGATVAAGGAIQIAKIRQTQYDSGGGGGGDTSAAMASSSTGSTASTSAPQPAGVNLDFLRNRPDQFPRAYVLAGDVTDAQAAREKTENLARISNG
jgi:hypothetical protein